MTSTLDERYPAVVTSNADPEQRGRIKVACAGILGDEETSLPMWVEPVFDWGWFYVPDVGEQVEVEVAATSTQDDVRGQVSLEGLRPRWRGKRHYGGTEAASPAVPTPVHADFSTNYGKRRGIATPLGHTLVFDDTEGDSSVTLTWVNADGVKSALNIDKDGSVHLTVLDAAHAVHVTKDKEFHATLDGNKHSVDLVAADKKFTVSLDEAKHVVVVDGAAPSFTASLAQDKHKIVLDGAGNEMLVSVNQGAGKLSLTGDKLQVDLGTSLHQLLLDSSSLAAKLGGMDLMKVETPGKMTLGLGTDNAVAFTPLSSIWSTVMGLISGHVHASLGSPSPTLTTLATVPPFDPAKSGNIKMPLG